MIYTIGIDIGMKGGIAVLKDGSLIALSDMPIVPETGDFDVVAIYNELKAYPTATVVYENVHAYKAQGVASTFAFGRAKGIIESLARISCAELAPVSPSHWKKHYPTLTGLEKSIAKQKAVELAQGFEPAASFSRAKKRGTGSIPLDGRAEAYLLARRHFELTANQDSDGRHR